MSTSYHRLMNHHRIDLGIALDSKFYVIGTNKKNDYKPEILHDVSRVLLVVLPCSSIAIKNNKGILGHCIYIHLYVPLKIDSLQEIIYAKADFQIMYMEVDAIKNKILQTIAYL